MALERRDLARVHLEIPAIGGNLDVFHLPFALRELLLAAPVGIHGVQVRVAVGFTDQPDLVAVRQEAAARIARASDPGRVLQHVDRRDLAASGVNPMQVSFLEVLPLGE